MAFRRRNGATMSAPRCPSGQAASASPVGSTSPPSGSILGSFIQEGSRLPALACISAMRDSAPMSVVMLTH
eukprot:15455363-Alexandrium_andersonii.AAC.1